MIMTLQPKKILCECNSFTCNEAIERPLAELIESQNAGVLIANSCVNGPDPTDILVAEKTEYKIYKERK